MLIESDFNLRQFSTSPPFEMNIQEDFVEHISADQEIMKRFSRAVSVVVQPSRTASQGVILFKCTKRRKYPMIDVLIEQGHQGYEETLLKELEQTIYLIEHEPRLTANFQFMIDMDGKIYHLDLDRVNFKGEPPLRKAKVCLENIIDYIKKSM